MEAGKPLQLADALRGFREKRGLTARALSVQAGLSDSYINKLEAGAITEPSLRAFGAIVNALKLEAGEILFCVRCLIADIRSGTDQDLTVNQ